MRVLFLSLLLLRASLLFSQQSTSSTPPVQPGYLIGPDDHLLIQVQEAPEFTKDSVRVDSNGLLDLPMAGTVKAGGRTVEQLRADIQKKLSPFIIDPKVTVNVLDARAQPVSILGSVAKPGEYQLVDRRTLYQVLSIAGGLATDAGSTVKITRKSQYGPIPLPSVTDPSGKFSVATIPVKAILDGSDPATDIVIQPYDIISVPRADRIYVIGSVEKPGAFLLNERATVSVLQALSLAEGAKLVAATQHAKILRHVNGNGERTESPINLKRVLAGHDPDVLLQPEDILFVPNSAAKQVSIRAAEAAVQAGTGLAIWR
jgi:polysaccharide export outer membrane protein